MSQQELWVRLHHRPDLVDGKTRAPQPFRVEPQPFDRRRGLGLAKVRRKNRAFYSGFGDGALDGLERNSSANMQG